MKLHTLPERKNRIKKKTRIGRGYGTGSGGHTVGRGTKGQKSRSGHKSMILFEGGNVPFYRRMPKYRGFKRNQKIYAQPINLDVINNNYSSDEVVSVETLRDKGLIRKGTTRVKVLSGGELNKKVVIKGLELSASAEQSVIASGSKVE